MFMNTQLMNVFNHQVTGQKFLDIFEDIARTITDEYEHEIIDFIGNFGYPPSFKELFERMGSLNKELNTHAAKVLNDYSDNKGHKSIKLTTGCKRIIKLSVNKYLRQLKTILNTERYSELSGFTVALSDV